MNSTTNSTTHSMITISNGAIFGGSFTQHVQETRVQKSAFDLLQDAVSPGAFYNSGERFDPPKCHPNTRVAVIKKIMDWVQGRDPETQSALVMWLYGAAGGGKSAIAQSIAELCAKEGHLVASFFFGRSDGKRNNAGPLFPTIAYQMILAIPQTKQKVMNAIECDPLIFKRSLSAQFTVLIIEPLLGLHEFRFFFIPQKPRLIIIDGLDECLDRQSQCQILDTIRDGIGEHRLPLIFLIASRPEHDISAKFNSVNMNEVLTRLALDDSYLPSADIELLLRDKFRDIAETHPLKRYIPNSWPSDDIIESLVRKSSGQFIYASTVVKYVASTRHRPHHRLDTVQNLRPAHVDLPFAELDVLYTHILSSVPDNIEQILHILSFRILDQAARKWSYSENISIDGIELILSLEPGDIEILFCDLSSIISIRREWDVKSNSLHILHASLPDFLLDRSRSGPFYINIVDEQTEHLRHCLQFLTSKLFAQESKPAINASNLAMSFFAENFLGASVSSNLRDDILAVSIRSFYNQLLAGGKYCLLHPHTICHFVGTFFEGFKSMGEEHHYAEQLCSFREVLIENLELYYKHAHLTLLVAVMHWYVHFNVGHQYPMMMWPREFKRDFHIEDTPYHGLYLSSALGPQLSSYSRLIYDFLEDPVQSGTHGLDAEKYATAAVLLLRFLCLCCRFRGRIDGPMIPEHTHRIQWVYGRITGDPDACVPMVECFIHFLNHAGKSEELIHFCNEGLFDPEFNFTSSQEEIWLKKAQELFPDQTNRGRRAMEDYLARIGVEKVCAKVGVPVVEKPVVAVEGAFKCIIA